MAGWKLIDKPAPISAPGGKVGGDEPEPIEPLAGQAFWVEGRVRVRYANVWDEESEYYALCVPAFAPDLADREG